MIRNLSLATLAAVAALGLAGCPGQLPTIGDPPPAPTPSAVKLKVLQGCGYVASLESVVQVLAAGNVYVQGAGAIAEAICQAVTNIPFADGPGDHKPRVNGVVIRGYFAKAR